MCEDERLHRSAVLIVVLIAVLTDHNPQVLGHYNTEWRMMHNLLLRHAQNV